MNISLIFKSSSGKKSKFEKPWPWGGMIPAKESEIKYTDKDTGNVFAGIVTKVKWDMGIDKVTIWIKEKEE